MSNKNQTGTEVKKIAKRQAYTFEHLIYEDGSTCLRRVNDGFTILELLGLMELTRKELFSVFESGYPKPDIITRQAVDCDFALELERAPEFDGHTPEDVLKRIAAL